MSAYNVVRFRVKPGSEQAFIDAHKVKPAFKGFKNGVLLKTGDRTFCLVAEWASFQKIVAARPQMIGMLDSFRDTLEDLGNGLGLTDPISGDVVLTLKAAKPKKKAAKAKKKKKKAK